MGKGGIALKSIALFFRLIQFACAAIILGIFSYFLAKQSIHHYKIPTWQKAVEGISGAGVIYTVFGLLLVCFLGGVAFFSFLGIILDVAFAGAFAYIIYATRHGANNCKNNVQTPFGDGLATDKPNGLTTLHTACKLNTAVFAIAIIGCFFFLLTILTELGLMKHHRHERRYGPSPNNGYTAGSPSSKRKFWQRKPKESNLEKTNPDALPQHTSPAAVRDSYATESTAVGGATYHEPVVSKYGAAGNFGQGAPPAAAHVNGHQTTTTTHVPAQGYTAYNPAATNTAGNF